MSDSTAALVLAAAALVVAFLVHFDAKRRDDQLEQRAIAREKQSRDEDAREAAIANVVDRYHMIMHQTGASANWLTVRQAGIAALQSDAEVREAIRRMARSGPHPLGAFAKFIDDQRMDLKKIFDYSVDNNVPFDRAVEAAYKKLNDPVA